VQFVPRDCRVSHGQFVKVEIVNGVECFAVLIFQHPHYHDSATSARGAVRPGRGLLRSVLAGLRNYFLQAGPLVAAGADVHDEL
jgi:hypothetical protein